MWVNGENLVRYETGFAEPVFFNDERDLRAMLIEAAHHGASDIFLQSMVPVLIKIHDVMFQLTRRALEHEEVMAILVWLTGSPDAKSDIVQGKDRVASYPLEHPTQKGADGRKLFYRFRVNAVRCRSRRESGCEIVLRAIPTHVPTVEEVGLPAAIVQAATPRNGIVYVTGSTGSGKTTTFAAILREVISGRTPISGNICSIEQPVEFVYESIDWVGCKVVQQEVAESGGDVRSFAEGVRTLMRRNPGLAIVGETRDWETASACMALARTGHPVFTTLHVSDVALIYQRLLGLCPAEERQGALFDLIANSRLLVNQVLAKKVGGGRVALREYLVMTEDIQRHLYANATQENITRLMREIMEASGFSIKRAAEDAYNNGLIDINERNHFSR